VDGYAVYAVGDRVVQHLVLVPINDLDPRIGLGPHHIYIVIAYGVGGTSDRDTNVRGVMHDVPGDEAVGAYGNDSAADTRTGVVSTGLIHNIVAHRALVREHPWDPVS